ncbi:segregation and condensation protein A [Desulfuromonas acetexigens]|uniref:Segregation and condensation protein A n=1 Tax=Trichloromonas acetexigens TaxID=38815 RepID=A0A550JKR0_9BACT|nr:segregation/condensation protein A [Desulfuromonas acetexigens]TRO83804.1 segregation/condensation protein A [Desulfuromonas acetexigens]
MSYDIKIDNFEGPLDLLLHLIRKNEMDIYNIPIAEITAQYLATIDTMQSLNLDVAGEFLLMAATLLHIKSRLLLPKPEEDLVEEDEEDPRAELVRRLLEYQKYQAAARELDEKELLGRELFARNFPSPELGEQEEDEFVAVGLYDLVEAMRALLRQRPQAAYHEVTFEQLSVSERINQILTRLADRERLTFGELFGESPSRHEVVVSFLAMLELVKLRMARLLQEARFGTIWLYPAVAENPADFDVDEEALGYG